ncbi:MAG: dihydroorotate dehydrogenase electron transfer subunit [Victivallales bacterium]|jgi:dihydroorotate dehydrogenase electron transfer subunit|nr:dihydroorotate dehydrogenase electron transfer subunit [Victivallales bacterium]
MMKNGEIIENQRLKGDYFKVRFYAPQICETARAGQFVHVRITPRGDRILRRPFSIYNCENDALEVVYKVVGGGTKELSELSPGNVCNLLGPLGVSFSDPLPGVIPVLVAGGYGAAATYLLTKQVSQRGIFLIGARSKSDVLLTDEYQKEKYEVRVATDDGSEGHCGFVTDLVAQLLKEKPDEKFFFYGCGPHPMLMALAKLLRANRQKGELSIDHLMCCGIGACFACVVKVKADTLPGWTFARACVDGPVFNLDSVYVE